jgi:hypothetical protein
VKFSRSTIEFIGGLELCERSLALLGQVSPRLWCCYLMGVGPIGLIGLYYLIHMSAHPAAEQDRNLLAFAVTVAGLWWRLCQARFASGLEARLAGAEQSELSWRELLLMGLRQTVIFAGYVLLLPIASLLVIPLVWMTAWFHQCCLVGGRSNPPLVRLIREGASQLFWGQSAYHTALMVASAVGFIVMVNLCGFVLFGPMLFKMMTGVESAITRSYWLVFNSTVLMTVCFVTYVVVSPFVRAIFVLRSYGVDSLTTGVDLRVRLQQFTNRRSLGGWLGAALLLQGISGVEAAESVSQSEIRQAIEEVMARPEFAWRLRTEAQESAGRSGLEVWVRSVIRWLEEWIDWFRDLIMPGPQAPGDQTLFDMNGFSRPLLFGLLLIVAIFLGQLIYRILKARRKPSTAMPELATTLEMPDLDDEQTLASDLPEDGWLALATGYLEIGDYRRALRAFYLSALAHLHGQRLIQITRGKSNATYLAEIQRYEHELPSLAECFDVVVQNFDRVWYGYYQIDLESLQHYEGYVAQILRSRRG